MKEEKINKNNPHCKRSKTLTVDNMILYIDNPKYTLKKLLELISEFSKVTRCKIDTQCKK